MKNVINITICVLIGVVLLFVPYIFFFKQFLAVEQNVFGYSTVAWYGYAAWTLTYYIGDKAGDLYKSRVLDKRIITFRSYDPTVVFAYNIPRRSHQKLAIVVFDLLVYNSSKPVPKETFENAMTAVGVKFGVVK